tara:strand:+ start:492 stop:1133 length:642 start_codon:yes stop_codon:yes gene_type:complete
MNNELLRFKKGQKYIIFDFETCNLNLASEDNKPWQLAYIIAEGTKVISKFDFYIKWDDLKISKDAEKITGFSRKVYNSRGECPTKVLNHFESFLYDPEYINVGHNILGFDIYIHNIFRHCLGKKADYSYLSRSIDTLSLGKAISKDIKYNPKEELSLFQFRLNSFRERGMALSLSACCKKYDVSFDPAKLHDALYDITKNFEVFNKMIWNVSI